MINFRIITLGLVDFFSVIKTISNNFYTLKLQDSVKRGDLLLPKIWSSMWVSASPTWLVAWQENIPSWTSLNNLSNINLQRPLLNVIIYSGEVSMHSPPLYHWTVGKGSPMTVSSIECSFPCVPVEIGGCGTKYGGLIGGTASVTNQNNTLMSVVLEL